jgi:prefoldin subunit 5
MATSESEAISVEVHTPSIHKIADRQDHLDQLFQAAESRWKKELADLQQAWSDAQEALENAASQISELADSIEQIEDTIEGLRSTLDGAASSVRSLIATECSQVTDALGNSLDACGDLRVTVDTRRVEWEASVVAVHQDLDSAAQFLETRFSEVAAAATAAGNSIDTAHGEFVSTVATQMSALNQAVSDFSISFRDEYMATSLATSKVTVDELTRAVEEQLITPMSSAVAEATSSIEGTAGELIDLAADAVGEGIDKVIESLRDISSETSGTRQVMVPLREQLKPVVEPIQDIVGAVGELASALGVST